jgi:hypothetical protein
MIIMMKEADLNLYDLSSFSGLFKILDENRVVLVEEID